MSGKMKDAVIKRGEGRYAVVLYEGKQGTRRCESCAVKVWVADHPGRSCRRCKGTLGPAVEEWRRRWHGPYKTLKDAKTARDALRKRINDGDYVTPDKTTVGDYLTSWLAAVRVKPTTRESYRANIENHLRPNIGAVPLQKLTTVRLNALYLSLEEGGGIRGGGLSPKTVKNVAALVHKVLTDAEKQGLVHRNVAEAAEAPKQKTTHDKKTWTAEELRRFLTYVIEDRLYAGWVLFATTGMRRGEVCGLRWRNLHLDEARLSVVESIVPVGYRAEVSTPKTNTGTRWIDLDAETVAALRAHKTRQGEERMALGLGKAGDDDYVFADSEGRPIHPHAISGAFQRHVIASGAPYLSLHGLRHTWASLALAAGVPVKVVSERLGHADVAFTMRQYQHVLPGMQKDAAEKMARVIFGRSV